MAAVAHRLGRDQVVWASGPDMTPVLEIERGVGGAGRWVHNPPPWNT